MLGKDRILQLDFAYRENWVILTCLGLDGHEVLRLKVQESDQAADVCGLVTRELARELDTSLQKIKIVLFDGQLLASVIGQAKPFAQLSDVIKIWAPRSAWIRMVVTGRLKEVRHAKVWTGGPCMVSSTEALPLEANVAAT